MILRAGVCHLSGSPSWNMLLYSDKACLLFDAPMKKHEENATIAKQSFLKYATIFQDRVQKVALKLYVAK